MLMSIFHLIFSAMVMAAWVVEIIFFWLPKINSVEVFFVLNLFVLEILVQIFPCNKQIELVFGVVFKIQCTQNCRNHSLRRRKNLIYFDPISEGIIANF